MLAYNNLSSARQRWVDLVEQHFPEVKLRGVVTFKEINSIHDFFFEKRESDKRYKISKPLWLITNNAISKGVYQFPASDAPEVETPVIDDKMELYYRSELLAHSIKPKP